MRPDKRLSWFTRLALHGSHLAGRPLAFMLALLVIGCWAVLGPLYEFSDRWMWVIHTATSIATFLLVFLLHHTEARDTEAIQVKLDELIRALDKTHKSTIAIETGRQEEIEHASERYHRLGERSRRR